MTANANRFSTYTSVSAGSGTGSGTGRADGDGKKKDLWNSMLDSVASGRKLPERNLLVFGGSVESQREFLEALALDPRHGLSGLDRQQNAKLPPVANNFALGYTYYDVLDSDQEDILARISLYLLSKPSPAFSSLLQPLITPQSIPNTLIVILLDWAQPWLWLRQLREWILLLRTVLVSLSPACKEVMEEAMLHWRERGRGGPLNLDGTTAAVDGDALPAGPGEWEDALGLPLCVVCQNAEKTDILEKTQGWKDDEFDLVLQYLRTVLVKHGASLIYTTPNIPSELPTLIHACLGVTSLLKRQPLKPEVIKRAEVVVPSNWDSWTKILVVREGFDVEKVSTGWSMDLQRPYPVVKMSKVAGDTSSGQQRRQQQQQKLQNQKVLDLALLHGADGEAVESAEYTYNGTEHEDAASDAYDKKDGSGKRYTNGYGHSSGSGSREDPDSAVSQYERAIRDPGMDVLAMAALAGQGDHIGTDADEDEDTEDSDDDVDDEEWLEYNDANASGDAGDDRRRPRQRHRRRRLRRQQKLEVETEDVQLFLGEQLKLLEQLRHQDEARREKEARESRRRGGSDVTGGSNGSGNGYHASLSSTAATSSGASATDGAATDPTEAISRHIGPVQFNIGGIQVDADDMLERIKNRHGYGSVSPEPLSPDIAKASGAAVAGTATGDDASHAPENIDTENLTAFFAGLMNRPSHTGKT